MEYSLTKHFSMNSCGWVDRVLDWETRGLGSTPGGITFENFCFFLNVPPKTGQSRLVSRLLWLVFYLNCRKINLVFQVS